MIQFEQEFKPLAIEDIHDHAAIRKASGWRYVQMLAVKTEPGCDLIYSFMKDGLLENNVVSGVTKEVEIPSISDLFLEAFVFENETHDLFGVQINDIAIDFAGRFYDLAVQEPMTIISPEQQAAREKARKLAAAKAAREAKAAAGEEKPAAQDAQEDAAALEEKLAGMDPEKAAKVRAAMEAKARKQAAAAAEAAPTEDTPKEGE